MKLFKGFVRLLWFEHTEIKLVLAYGIGFAFLNLVFPIGVQAILSNLNYGTLLQPVLLVSLLVLLVLALSSVLQLFQVYLIEIIQRRIFSRVTLSIGKFIPKTRSGAFTVELMNQFFEVTHIQKMQHLILMDGLGTIFQTFLGLLLLAFYHPYLLIFDILFLFILYLIIFVLGNGGIKTGVNESKEKYRVASWLEEVTRHRKIFSRSTGAKYALHKTDNFILDYLSKREKHFRILFRQYFGISFLFVLGSAGALFLGSWLVIKGELTVGQLVAVEIIISGIMFNVFKFGKYIESGYDMLASYDKLESIFNVSHLAKESTQTLSVDSIQNISLQNLVYSPTPIHAQQGISIQFGNIQVSAGEKISVFGKSGSGKSTLANILCGFEAFDRGEYLINGISLQELPKQEVFDRFFLLEKPTLFKGTILQNITLEKGELEQKELSDIMENVPYISELFDLEKGLSTYVYGLDGEFSDRIKMIVSFIRAIYAKPDFFVIAQTFDGLGDDFRQEFIKYLEEKCPQMAVILITSDQDLVKVFSRSLNLEKVIA